MKALLAKLAACRIGGIKSVDFERVVDWVIEAGRDPAYQTGFEQMMRVVAMYNANFAKQASWVVRTIIQLAYFIAKSRGEDT